MIVGLIKIKCLHSDPLMMTGWRGWKNQDKYPAVTKGCILRQGVICMSEIWRWLRSRVASRQSLNISWSTRDDRFAFAKHAYLFFRKKVLPTGLLQGEVGWYGKKREQIVVTR